MLTTMIRKVFWKAYKKEYFIEIVLMTLILSAIIFVGLQYKVIESYENQEDTSLSNFHPFTNNNQWQHVNGTRNNLYVYSAYYDDRNNGNTIRINGVASLNFDKAIQCQLYFSEGETEHIFVSADVETLDKSKDADLVAVFVICALPEGLPRPHAVAVKPDSEMMISNLLLVQRFLPRTTYNQSHRESVAVCVNPLQRNYSQELRLMEFIELNTILGADHFIFYVHSISEDLKCLLTDYVKQGRVSVKLWNIPTSEKYESDLQHLASNNDCLYQTMRQYEYTLFLSIDEFLIPKEVLNIKDLLRTKESESNRKNVGAYLFKVANFYLEWPDEKWKGRDYFGGYLMTMYKIYRTAVESSNFSTAVIKPETVLRFEGENELIMISGFEALHVEAKQGLCHRYRLAGAPPAIDALQDTTAHKYIPRLLRALTKQYIISETHCSLQDVENVHIHHLKPNNVPILLEDLQPKTFKYTH